MKKTLLAIGMLSIVVSMDGNAQTSNVTNVIIPRGPGFRGGPLTVVTCPKDDNCEVEIFAGIDPFNADDCLLRVPDVVIASKKSKRVSWKITAKSGGPYRFNMDPVKAIEVAKNFDNSGQEAFGDHKNESADKHSKEVKTGDAKAFAYTIRVDSRTTGTFKACTDLDPVIVSRD